MCTLSTFNAGFGNSHTAQETRKMPYFNSEIPNSSYFMNPFCATLFYPANGVYSLSSKTNNQFAPAFGFSIGEATNYPLNQLAFFGVQLGGTGSLTSTQGLTSTSFSSGICHIFKQITANDNTAITNGTNSSANAVYLNSNATLTIASSENLKQQITKLDREKDNLFAKNFVENVNLYTYSYKHTNSEIQRHSQKTCSCANQEICDELKYNAFETSCKRHLGFLAEEIKEYDTI